MVYLTGEDTVWDCRSLCIHDQSSWSVKWLVTVHPWPEIGKRRKTVLRWFPIFPFELVYDFMLWIVPTHIQVESPPSLSLSLTDMFRGVSPTWFQVQSSWWGRRTTKTHECVLYVCQARLSLPHTLSPRHSCWGKLGHTKWINTPEPSLTSREHSCSVLLSGLFDHYNMPHYCKMRSLSTKTAFETMHFLNIKST